MLLAAEQSNLNTSLYDLSSGQELLDLSGWWASFTPDSRHLSLGSTNEEMTYGYDLELDDLVRLAESRITRKSGLIFLVVHYGCSVISPNPIHRSPRRHGHLPLH